MKRRTLDILFSGGGVLLAALLLILGLVMSANASFAKNYVRDQLSQQKITFPAVDKMTAEEKQSANLVKYAGQPLTTGKQAETYANDFIGLHLREIKGANGKTYAELGGVQAGLRAQIAAAQKTKDPALANLQKELADVTTARDTVFKGETLRGLLLTSFGFAEMGTKASQVATVAYLVAALMALLSAAGFVHAFRTPRTVPFAAPEKVQTVKASQQLAGV